MITLMTRYQNLVFHRDRYLSNVMTLLPAILPPRYKLMECWRRSIQWLKHIKCGVITSDEKSTWDCSRISSLMECLLSSQKLINRSTGSNRFMIFSWYLFVGCASLTLSGRRLQLVAGQLAPAHGVEVRRLAVHPLVVLILPAVKVDPQQPMDDPSHRGDAHQPRLHQVYGLQLHAGAKAVVWNVLRRKTEIKKRCANIDRITRLSFIFDDMATQKRGKINK